MAKIAIVGPGAVGGIMAAWLARSGEHELIACARRPFEEMVVETPAETLVVRPTVFTDPREVPPVDFVLVATKTYAAAETAKWFARLCARGAPVAILQNGVEHRERFAPYLPAEQIVPVLVYCPSERTSLTALRQRRKGWLVAADDAHGAELARLFAGTAIDVKLTADWKSEAWRKLTLNAAGVLNALLLRPAGVFQDEQVAELARAVMGECVAVGRAEGAALEDGLLDEILRLYAANPADSINSLHADVLAGRPTELAARNGIIVRLGKKHGIPTPCNQMAVTLLEKRAAATGT